VPKIEKNTRYDSNDKESILRFAGELTETTLREWVVPEHRKTFKGKGQFGQILEKGVFYIETNSESRPDFEVAGIELKSTPIKKLKRGEMVPKERLSLSNINYTTILDEGWEGSFWNKNKGLLIIFYLYEKGKDIYDLKILGSILWKYPEEDLNIIKNDWNTIAEKVRLGEAHKISERDTAYLSASRKGAGGNKDNRNQPHSSEKAPQRAFALKPAYVNSIWKEAHKADATRVRNAVPYRIFTYPEQSASRTIEEEVLSRFDEFKGMLNDDIWNRLECPLGPSSKQYNAQVARKMIGVKGTRILEFEKADIEMKIVRLKSNGVPKESMSFPHFDYIEESGLTWEESDFYHRLRYKRFLFVVFDIKNDGTYFRNAVFWSMPESDFSEAERVWRLTTELIKEGNISGLPKISDSRVAHVRPHGKNSSDTIKAPDGKMYVKRCFWLNASYIGEQLNRLGTNEGN